MNEMNESEECRIGAFGVLENEKDMWIFSNIFICVVCHYFLYKYV